MITFAQSLQGKRVQNSFEFDRSNTVVFRIALSSYKLIYSRRCNIFETHSKS